MSTFLLQFILCPKCFLLFALKGLRERAHTSHNGAALKDDKTPDGKDRTALFARTESGPLLPFPPNNVTRPAARTRSPSPKDYGLIPPFPPNNVTRPATRSKSSPSKSSGSLPPFPPNNVTRPAARSRLPPPPRKTSKKAADDQWSLQRNEKGEVYYFNTTTFDWQIETPDCLKKYTTR